MKQKTLTTHLMVRVFYYPMCSLHSINTSTNLTFTQVNLSFGNNKFGEV